METLCKHKGHKGWAYHHMDVGSNGWCAYHLDHGWLHNGWAPGEDLAWERLIGNFVQSSSPFIVIQETRKIINEGKWQVLPVQFKYVGERNV